MSATHVLCLDCRGIFLVEELRDNRCPQCRGARLGGFSFYETDSEMVYRAADDGAVLPGAHARGG